MFGDLNERQEEYLRDILNSGNHLLELLNEILDLSKVEAGRMELELSVFSLRRTIEHALALVRERAALHRIAITLEMDPSLDLIESDELRFKQVMLNLLSNAVKFTPNGGRVAVRAVRTGQRLAVTVTDNGIGIARRTGSGSSSPSSKGNGARRERRAPASASPCVVASSP